VKFLATKKVRQLIFFPPLSFVPVFASKIRDGQIRIQDPGWVNQDPGSGTANSHHWRESLAFVITNQGLDPFRMLFTILGTKQITL
jgi:hypothetical protein